MTGEHQPRFIKFPVLVSVRPEPVALGVVPFIGKANGDAVARECPQFLDQAIVRFALPLTRQKFDDLGAAVDEFMPVAPPAIDGVRERHALRVPRIPGVLREADFSSGAIRCKWRDRRTGAAGRLAGIDGRFEAHGLNSIASEQVGANDDLSDMRYAVVDVLFL